MPIYFLSTFSIPASVAALIERLQRNFLWGLGQDQRKICWISWKNICKPSCHGELDIKDINRSLLYKWLWRFGLERDALWKRVIAAKYGEECNGWLLIPPLGVVGSGVWKGICAWKDQFSHFIWFKINRGDRVSFWHDRWCSTSPLAHLFPHCYHLAVCKRGVWLGTT